MKKKTKNTLYKFGIGLGGLTAIVAPLATTVSFAGNTRAAAANVGGPEWQAFIDKVNDKTTETTLSDDFNAVKSKFAGSQFYRDQIKLTNGVWDLQENNDIYAALVTLLESKEFTDAEKVTIGKFIINNEAVDDAFENFGFDKNITTTSTEIKSVKGDMPDITHPSSTTAFITATDWANNQATTIRNLKGKTGFNIDYNPSTYHDRELEISNVDSLAYFINVITMTQEYKDLRKLISTLSSDVMDSAGGNYVQIFGKYFTALNNFVSKITDDPDTLTQLSCFGALKTVDLSNSKTDDDAITTILTSNLGKALYGEGAQDILDTYKDPSISGDQDGKNAIVQGILTTINTHLTPLGRVQSAQVNYLKSENPSITTNSDGLEALISFVRMLAKESDNFTQDVQLHSRTSILGNHSLSVKSDFNSKAWTPIEKEIKIPYWFLADTPLNMDLKFSDSIIQLPLDKTTLKTGKDNKIMNYDEELKSQAPKYIRDIRYSNSLYSGKFFFTITIDGKSESSSALNWIVPKSFVKVSELAWWTNLAFSFPNNSGLLTFNANNVPTISSVTITVLDGNDPDKFAVMDLPILKNSLNNALLEVKNEVLNQDIKNIPGFDPNAAISRTITISNLATKRFEMFCYGGTVDHPVNIGTNNIQGPSFNLSYSITQNPEIS